MKRRSLSYAAAIPPVLLLIAAIPASAAEIIGGFAITYTSGGTGTYDSQYTSGTDMVSTHTEDANFASSARSQTSAWNNRIETNSEIKSPPTGPGATTFASAQSLYAVNQIITGPGTTAHANYQFSVSGSFSPGPDEYFPEVITPQNLIVYLIAYYGTVLSTELRGDGVFVLHTTNGISTLNLLPEDPRYVDENLSFIIPGSFASACAGSCKSPVIFDNDILNIDVDIDVGREFSVVALVSAFSNGQSDFFHTVKLDSITLDPAFTLTADDGGALTRNADGSYALAAVPEPATWATMLFGLALVGGALRYRRQRGWRNRYSTPR